jgi:hypothetical protein
MKRKGRLHLEDYVSEDGENSNGMTNVGAYGTQVGTRPQDMMGRQEYGWGPSRDGDNFGSYGPDYFLSEKEKSEMFGGVPTFSRGSKRKK